MQRALMVGQPLARKRVRNILLVCRAGPSVDDVEFGSELKDHEGPELEASSGNPKRHSYERNLQGLKRVSFVTDVIWVCNWSLGVCALTWASAVLLGAYVQSLSMWDYYDVSLLLFVVGLRFGVAALLRIIGIYSFWPVGRWALRSAEIFTPLWMGGFALLSILPQHIRKTIYGRFLIHGTPSPPLPPPQLPAPSPDDALNGRLLTSLNIFYALILANAFVLLLGSSVTGIMRSLYVRSNAKSLTSYHDKMLVDNSSWMQAGVDLEFAFQMQSHRYRRGEMALQVCRQYVDLIWYVFLNEKGMEAAEAALKSEDGYVRETAANMVGFWAVLERLDSAQSYKLPLCYHKEVLSNLAKLARKSYGPIGTAAARSLGLLPAARSLGLLLEADGDEVIAMVLSGELKLVDILLQRAAKLLKLMQEQDVQQGIHEQKKKGVARDVVQKELGAHIYALRQVLLCLKGSGSVNGELRTGQGLSFTQDQCLAAQNLVQKMSKDLNLPLTNPPSTIPTTPLSSTSAEAFQPPRATLPSTNSTPPSTNSTPPSSTSSLPSTTSNKAFASSSRNSIHPSPTSTELTRFPSLSNSTDEPIHSLDLFLSNCLSPSHREWYYSQGQEHTKYYSTIKSMLMQQTPPHTPRRRLFKLAGFLLLFNGVTVPLTCLGVGFIVKALIPHDHL